LEDRHVFRGGGLYIGKYLLPFLWEEEKISADVIWGKNIKRGRENVGENGKEKKNAERKRKWEVKE
jgi:hypothetical protein